MTDREASVRRRLAELVAIDSTSVRSNAPVVEALEKELRALGFDCRRHPYRDSGGVEKVNLVSVRPGRSGKAGDVPALALVGHTDCVPFDPAWKEALKLEERGGKLYGRGACDTKAFIACALEAAARVREHDAPLMAVFTADEELGCFGAKQLVDAGDRPGALRHRRRAHVSSGPVHANKGYCLAGGGGGGEGGAQRVPGVGRVGHLPRRAAAGAAGAVRAHRAARRGGRQVRTSLTPP